MTCRRCSDCVGRDHHWLDNLDGQTEYACKHCPALGEECGECQGEGSIEHDDGDEDECPACRGHGVIFVGYESELN